MTPIFSPEFSRKLADAFRSGGGKADVHTLPAFGSEGHWLPETESGVKLAAGDLDRALKLQAATKKRFRQFTLLSALARRRRDPLRRRLRVVLALGPLHRRA